MAPIKFTLALDVQIEKNGTPRPALRGWQDASTKTLWQVVDDFAETGLKSILVTDIAKDGVLQGANTSLYQEFQSRYPKLDLITSGGVGSIERRAGFKSFKPVRYYYRQSFIRKQIHFSAGNFMLARRIIPCLDVRDGVVVKGVQFRNHEVVGNILDLAKRYVDQGADELVFYDITASTDGRTIDSSWVAQVSACIDIPFCVAGGIKSVEAARIRLEQGADKISVNSPALMRPDLINELKSAFGRQCIVVGIDSFFDGQTYRVKSHTGDAGKTRETGRQTLEWIEEATLRGAGEIVLNCMNKDGVRTGYDLEQLTLARKVCSVPSGCIWRGRRNFPFRGRI